MARLGKCERLAKRAKFQAWNEYKASVVASNLKDKAPKPSSQGYASASRNFEQSMTHGLYRGLYDPMFSSDRDTKRGRKPFPRKSAKAVGASEVKKV